MTSGIHKRSMQQAPSIPGYAGNNDAIHKDGDDDGYIKDDDSQDNDIPDMINMHHALIITK